MTEPLFLTSLALLWLGVAYVVVLTLAGVRFYSRWMRRMAAMVVPTHTVWPGVTVLIPAHNEERVIDRSLERFRALDYPNLEIVVVDDASSDRTGAICDQIAARDRRVKVLHVPPSEGGRGKSAALNRGLEYCHQPYVAVYDADHRPRPDVLKRLVFALQSAEPRRRYIGATGRIVKFNRARSLLNRFASLEFTAFQWIFQ